MLKESQKRALRAKTLLDMGGHDPKTVARECGYTSVNAMLGAIAMCDGIPASHTPAAKPDIQAMTREEHAKRHPFLEKRLRTRVVTHEESSPEGRTLTMTIYPVENGTIWFRREDIAISYRPGGKIGPTVHINDVSGERRSGHPRWLALAGKDVGGKPGIIRMLRQISEAASECAALIEDEIKGGR